MQGKGHGVRFAWGRLPLNSGSKVSLCVLLLSLGVNVHGGGTPIYPVL